MKFIERLSREVGEDGVDKTFSIIEYVFEQVNYDGEIDPKVVLMFMYGISSVLMGAACDDMGERGAKEMGMSIATIVGEGLEQGFASALGIDDLERETGEILDQITDILNGR